LDEDEHDGHHHEYLLWGMATLHSKARVLNTFCDMEPSETPIKPADLFSEKCI